MPLTQTQASDQYIINSFSQFLDRTVKTPYDTFAAATSTATEQYPTPVQIMLGEPDDPTIVLSPPVIAISFLPSSERNRSYAIGDVTLWRYMNLVLCCYPSLRQDGQPSQAAAFLLSSCVKDAFGTETIRVLDFSNPSFSADNILYANDVMYIISSTNPMSRNLKTNIAAEKHRFDVHLSVRYPVIESLAN